MSLSFLRSLPFVLCTNSSPLTLSPFSVYSLDSTLFSPFWKSAAFIGLNVKCFPVLFFLIFFFPQPLHLVNYTLLICCHDSHSSCILRPTMSFILSYQPSLFLSPSPTSSDVSVPSSLPSSFLSRHLISLTLPPLSCKHKSEKGLFL